MKQLLTTLTLIGALLLPSCDIPFNPIPSPPSPYTNTEEETTEQYEIPETIVEETEIEETEPIEPEPIQRNDMLVNMWFNDYRVGDLFLFTGKIQNARIEPLYLDNATGSLEWRLMKGEKLMDTSRLDFDFFLKLKEYGWLEYQVGEGEASATFSNMEIDYDQRHANIDYPLSLTKKFEMPNYKFKESGTYHMKVLMTYEYEGVSYDSKFTSAEFEVGE